MPARRILTHGLAPPPVGVPLRPGDRGTCAAMLVPDVASPPEPGSLKGLTFLADTAKEAERLALASFGEGGAQN